MNKYQVYNSMEFYICIHPCEHYPNQLQNTFNTPKYFLILYPHKSLTKVNQYSDFQPHRLGLCVLKFHRNGITHYVLCCDIFTALNLPQGPRQSLKSPQYFLSRVCQLFYKHKRKRDGRHHHIWQLLVAFYDFFLPV